jgi:hypothetical protein
MSVFDGSDVTEDRHIEAGQQPGSGRQLAERGHALAVSRMTFAARAADRGRPRVEQP